MCLKKWLLAGTVCRSEKCSLFWDRGFLWCRLYSFGLCAEKKSGLSCGAVDIFPMAKASGFTLFFDKKRAEHRDSGVCPVFFSAE